MQTPKYTERRLKCQLINTFVGNHDLVCECNAPLEHCRQILNEELDKYKPKCLPTTSTGEDKTTTDGDVKEEDVIEEGDLEDLFKEDFDDVDG